MKPPSIRVKIKSDKTLADLSEWVLAECDFESLISIQRFRVGEYAYGFYSTNRPPLKQNKAKEYTVREIIGTIISE